MSRTDSRFGILALLGGTIVMLFLLVAIARYPSLFLRGKEYHAIFESVAGLNSGDEVRYGGLLVGSVTELDLYEQDPTHIVVTFRVRDRTPVRTDTRASITQVGLLGEPYLALHAGKVNAAPLPEGDFVPTDHTMSFQEAVNRLAVFFDRADTLLTGIERIARTSPWDRLDRTLARVEEIVETASTSAERVLSRLDDASGRLNSVLIRTERLIAVIDTAVGKSGPELAATQREALATLRETHGLVRELRTALEAGGGMEKIVRDVAIAADNLATLTSRLERNPSSVLMRRETPRKTVGPTVRD